MDSRIPKPFGSEFFGYYYYESDGRSVFFFLCVCGIFQITNKASFSFFLIAK